MAREAAASTQLAHDLRPHIARLGRLMRSEKFNHGISQTQSSVLGTLDRVGPMSAGELATAEGVQPPTITKVLANLEERGLIRRAVHPLDRRLAIIALTPAGRRHCDAGRKSRDAWFSRLLDTLGDDERATLQQAVPILEKLVAACRETPP